jgi:hypothetical protein
MKADGIIILILVFSIITIAIGGLIGDIRNNYDVNVSTSWENKYNFANEINDTVSDIKTSADEVGKTSGWLSIISGASALWAGVKTTAILIWNIPGYAISIIRGVASDAGLPPIISDIIIPIFIVMILVVIAFIVARMIIKQDI